mmetsp:Transcript_60268/g.153056  ORF Transcript_60268/g.153056 Transcript_60268/m.153056 type:complete len:337 (-) Transcript_60268:391-1401(-)
MASALGHHDAPRARLHPHGVPASRRDTLAGRRRSRCCSIAIVGRRTVAGTSAAVQHVYRAGGRRGKACSGRGNGTAGGWGVVEEAGILGRELERCVEQVEDVVGVPDESQATIVVFRRAHDLGGGGLPVNRLLGGVGEAGAGHCANGAHGAAHDEPSKDRAGSKTLDTHHSRSATPSNAPGPAPGRCGQGRASVAIVEDASRDGLPHETTQVGPTNTGSFGQPQYLHEPDAFQHHSAFAHDRTASKHCIHESGAHGLVAFRRQPVAHRLGTRRAEARLKHLLIVENRPPREQLREGRNGSQVDTRAAHTQGSRDGLAATAGSMREESDVGAVGRSR